MGPRFLQLTASPPPIYPSIHWWCPLQPTYDYVCSGSSGHTEAVQVFYNPKEVSFETLCQVRGGPWGWRRIANQSLLTTMKAPFVPSHANPTTRSTISRLNPQLLFSRIDPTLKNQVGNDRGTQYRRVIDSAVPAADVHEPIQAGGLLFG